MDLENKRAAARALTPWRDQVADRVKMFFIKLGFWVAIIVIICLISYNHKGG